MSVDARVMDTARDRVPESAHRSGMMRAYNVPRQRLGLLVILLSVMSVLPCSATVSLDEILSCLETNGVLSDRSRAVRGGIEGILRSIDPGAVLGGGHARRNDVGSTDSGMLVKPVELWSEDLAYLKIIRLMEGSGQEILNTLQSLNGKAGIILDLRGVTGDDLDSVSHLAGLAYPQQEPLYVMTDNQGRSLSTNRVESARTIHTPLMVLVDGETRGAAEALAALWRGRPGIMLIGSDTPGESRFRDTITLPDGQVITLATRRLIPLKGESYEGCGIKPDVSVPGGMDGNVTTLFSTNTPARALSEKSIRDRELMRRVSGDPVLQRATDILLGLRTLCGYGQP